MNWTKLIYVLIIVLLYIPMVFLGANIFFPEYTGENSYYKGYYMETPYPMTSEKLNETQMREYNAAQQKINEENEQKRMEWEAKKNAYEGNKYVIITIFNLIVLLGALFIPRIQDSVVMGLFLGSVATTFGATIRYFETKSKIGFVILLLTFIAAIYFINRKKDTFLNKKEEPKKKTGKKKK